ncbi:hypothetical protein PHYBOEH_008639 [Phytophthora boehmeriae]|uniref:Uncharacterized protein n=1 Tax=Phytophthora boehmeriae TaxID=109152 RepID=A0A8T1X2M7_9STRA|nr:hypothetical protein PHYBOEH_008639 [Phytophthora boehmeriae]
MGDVRTEIWMEIFDFADMVTRFELENRKIWRQLQVLDVTVSQVMRVQRTTLKWARENRLFIGRYERGVSATKYVCYNLLLIAFGHANRYEIEPVEDDDEDEIDPSSVGHLFTVHNHLGHIVTRGCSRERMAQVILERYRQFWRNTVQNDIRYAA